jgi:CHAT domain-containing protein/tetratricopeptide (TPR) repeat protein
LTAVAPRAEPRADASGLHPASLADCDRAIRARPDEHEARACFVRLAHTWGRGREPVERHLEQWVRRHPDDLLAQLWLGILAHDNSQLDEAVRLLGPVADAFQARGMDRGEVLARAEMAIGLCFNGRTVEGGAQLPRLEAAAERSGDPELQANAVLAEGVCARKNHDHGLAIALLNRARTLLVSAPRSFRTDLLGNQILDNLGASLSDSGRHAEAYTVFIEQLEVAKEDPFLVAIVRHRLASQAVNLADAGEVTWEEADRRIQDSLDMERTLTAPHWPPNATRILHAARLGPSPEAITELDRALAYWRPRAAWGVLTSLRLRAKYLADLDPAHPEEALREVAESLALAQATANHWNVGMALLVRAHVRWKSGDRPGGISDALATLDELDRLRDFQVDQLVRAWTSSETGFAYPLVAGWLVDPARGAPSPEDLEHAFQAMERHRARVLLEALVSARIEPAVPAGPLRDRQAATLADISHLQRQLLQPGLDPEDRRRALAGLQRDEQEEETIRDALARTGPRSSVLELSPPTLAEVQRALGADEALLSFETWRRKHDQDATYADGSSWLMAITREAVRTVRIPDEDRLREEVDQLRALLDGPANAEMAGAARLHRELLADALGTLPPGVLRLVLVLDGPLHRLPFEVLRSGPAEAPFGVRYSFSVVPSAALWLRWRGAPAPAPFLAGGAPLALVLANPSIPGQPGGTPAPEREGRAWVEGGPLPPLEFAEREAKAISGALGGRTLTLAGPEASERRLKAASLRGVSILHFAAHAVVDERNPGHSALVLAPGGPEEDGLFQVREVTGLDLTGKLVVLAACRSASGAVLGGEGPVSLARAFFQAGAPVVVGSSRPLQDEASTELMSSFYGGLARGLTVSSAMREARAARVGAGATAGAWAGLTVLGDGAVVPFPGSVPRSHTAPVVAVAVAIAVVAGLVLRARARRERRTG